MGLLVAHVVALVFGLAGMLIALPNPQLWAASPLGREVFTFGMAYAGGLHIIFGAAAMLAWGLAHLGKRRALVFLVVSVSVSLSSELIGTATGWPFGNYAYQEGLGWKVLGRVPFTIPLSWFYMGLASLSLAGRVLASRPPAWRAARLAILAVLGGAWLLMGWDLVLDPAMAHDSLPLKFWVWSERGSYFGMPVKNLAAWFVTGLVYMALSVWLWGRQPDWRVVPMRVPLLVYLANLVFASVLSLSVGLWQPIPLALVWAALLLLVSRLNGRPAAVLNEGGRLTAPPGPLSAPERGPGVR
jgi:putative membrane protein